MLEFRLTPVGKLFFASLIAWIVHDTAFNWKLRGHPEKVQAMARAIINSKRFQEELKRPGASVNSVLEKLNLKNLSAQNYTALTKLPWPL